jgi:proline iminopeptidase
MTMVQKLTILFAIALSGFSASLYAQQGVVQRDGFELHYYVQGSGKPIIFLSGGPGIDVESLEEAGKLFPVAYERVFLEQRGTGRSRPQRLDASNMSLHLAVEDLEALRKQLGLEHMVLVGHSWGGMLAMAYAASHPELVGGLILIGAGGPTREYVQWFGDNIEVRLHSEDREMAAYWDNAAKHGVDPNKAALESLKAILPAFFFDRAKALAFAAAHKEGSLHADTNSLMMADVQKHYDLRDGLARVSCPALIVQGHQDPIGDKTAEDIHILLRGSVIRYINRCGHFPWIEQPEQFKRAVEEFLAAH